MTAVAGRGAPASSVAVDAEVGVVGAGALDVATCGPETLGLCTLWWQPIARSGLLVACDVLALFASSAIAWLVWARPVHGHGPFMYTDLSPVLVVFVLGYALFGLYPGFGLGAVEVVRRLSLATSFTFMALAAAMFVLKLPSHYSRVTIVLAWIIALVVVPVARYLLLASVSHRKWWGMATVLVGDAGRAAPTLRLLQSALSLGYRPVAILAASGRPDAAVREGVPVVGGVDQAARLAAVGVTTALIIDGDDPAGNALGAGLQRHFRHVVLLRAFDQLPVEGVAIRNLGGVLGIEFTNDLLLLRNRFVKRSMDVILGGLSFLLAIPLITFGALLVKLVSRGPAFFYQDREGRDGRRIRVWKLRTMRADAESVLRDHLAASPEASEEWQARFKLPSDPRVIPGVGVVLRRFSIDELPQLWSVIVGDMSLVGPRPFPEYHLQKFSPEFRALRRHVRPGITGLWQVMIRSDGGVEEQRLFDGYYIRNWSVWMDLYILAKTPFVVVQGKGAY